MHFFFQHEIAQNRYIQILIPIKPTLPITYLVSVTRRLVVIWEWNNGSAHTEDHSRMNLTVSVCVTVGLLLFHTKVLKRHSNHNGLLLRTVNVFYHTTGY